MRWQHFVSKFSFLELIGAVFSREWLGAFTPTKSRESDAH